jgi:hypothetical protein
MLVEEEAASIYVAAKEGRSAQSHRHHFGGGEAHLRVIVVSGGLQELFAQAVDGDYGIVQ